MNPEAVEWLESLTEEQHAYHFAPPISGSILGGSLFSIKGDHTENPGNPCWECSSALHSSTLVVIE